MKSGISTLAKFVAGSAFGATLGATIGLLMAPKSGSELQADTAAYLETLKVEGERARIETEAQMAERFRQKVNDPDALTQKA